MKQLSVSTLALSCIAGATLASAKPTAYSSRPFQISQVGSPQFGTYITNSKGFGRREVQEDPALLVRAAQVNFQASRSRRPSNQASGSRSHYRSAPEVESRTKKLKKLRKLVEVPAENHREEHVEAIPPHDPTPATAHEVVAEVESRDCLADLEARFSPIKAFAIYAQLKRIKGQLMKDKADGATSEAVNQAQSTQPSAVEGRDLEDEELQLAIRTFSNALDSIDEW